PMRETSSPPIEMCFMAMWLLSLNALPRRTPRLSCGACAQSPIRRQPPARRQLEPVSQLPHRATAMATLEEVGSSTDLPLRNLRVRGVPLLEMAEIVHLVAWQVKRSIWSPLLKSTSTPGSSAASVSHPTPATTPPSTTPKG